MARVEELLKIVNNDDLDQQTNKIKSGHLLNATLAVTTKSVKNGGTHFK